MTCEEGSEICTLKTLLSKAQLLMSEIGDLLDWHASTGPLERRCYRTVHAIQLCQFDTEEDADILVIDGFRFESAASREDLRRMSLQGRAATGSCHGAFCGRQGTTRSNN